VANPYSAVVCRYSSHLPPGMCQPIVAILRWPVICRIWDTQQALWCRKHAYEPVVFAELNTIDDIALLCRLCAV
jgi:hypothetical protein